MGISTEDLRNKGRALKEQTVKLSKTIKWSILDIVDAAMKNKRSTLPVLGIVLIAVVAIIVLTGRPEETVEVMETQMEENAYPEINVLVAEYMTAKADGDMDTIYALRNYVSDEERLRIMALSNYIESYDNLVCYTKKLPEEGYTQRTLVEDAYLTFIYSEAKLYEIDKRAPSIQSYYAYRDVDGEYYFYSGDLEENVNAVVNKMMEDEDVQELYNQVEVKYQEAIDGEPALKEAMENQIPNSISKDMGEILAAEIAAESDSVSGNDTPAPEEETEPEEPDSQQPDTEPTIQYVKATTVVNVRSSDSETADKLGQIQPGDKYKLYENRINGWSKIDYNGKEAFVKTEFLDMISEETEGAETAAQETTTAPSENPPANTAETPLKASGGYVTAKSTVNVRKSASQDSEKLGVVYQGEKLELIMQQADGWCKVKYKGKTAYVKTEYLE